MEQNQAGGKDPKREELKRTIKFVLFSISAGAIEIGVFTVLYEMLHWEYWVAYLIALVLSGDNDPRELPGGDLRLERDAGDADEHGAEFCDGISV